MVRPTGYDQAGELVPEMREYAETKPMESDIQAGASGKGQAERVGRRASLAVAHCRKALASNPVLG